MARAALSWSLDHLAAAAGVNRKTILAFERGERRPREANAAAIRRAFEEAGLRFLYEGWDVGGVVPPLGQTPPPT
jgi:DNA-binding XRE family transcriptional regulator